MEGEVFGRGTLQGNFTLGVIHQNSFTKILYFSCFIFVDSILHVEMRNGNHRDKFPLGLKCLEYLSVKTEPHFPVLFKKDQIFIFFK